MHNFVGTNLALRRAEETMRFLFSILTLSGLSVVLVPAGCSSGSSCDSPSKCASDPNPDTASIQKCKDETAGPCAATYKALADCLAGAGCTAAGTTDASKCSKEVSAYTACKVGGADSGADTGVMDSGGGMDAAKDGSGCKMPGVSCQGAAECCSMNCDPTQKQCH